MRTWLAFGDLKEGDRFRFVYGVTIDAAAKRFSEEVYVKTTRGWYKDRGGNSFRTSRLTAVKLEGSKE